MHGWRQYDSSSILATYTLSPVLMAYSSMFMQVRKTFRKISRARFVTGWGTGIRGLIRGMATLPKVTKSC